MSQYITIPVDHEIALKPAEPANAAALYALIESSRSYLATWLPWVMYSISAKQTEQFIRQTTSKKNRLEQVVYVIWYKNQITGLIDLHFIDTFNRKAYIGYWLGQSWQGRGIMTRACRSLIDMAFDFYDLNRIVIRCAEGNDKSSAIPLRLGFAYEGTERQSEWLNGRFVNLRVYSILKQDWK